MSKKRLQLFASFIGADVAEGEGAHAGMKRYQIGETGTYRSPFGDVTITDAQFREAVRNFSANARGTVHPKTNKPAVHWDYSHDMAGPAAGWIHDLETDGGKLFAWTTWTPKAEQALKDEEFIGASMEIDFDYEDDSEKKWGTVLIGSALTNIPRIKNMEPIALDEANAATKETPVDITKLLEEAAKLSAEDRTKLLNEVLKLEGKPGLLAENATLTTQLSELKAKMAQGADAAAQAKITQLSEELAQSKAEQAKQAKLTKFSEMLAAGKAVPAQKDAYMSGDMELFASLAGSTAQLNLNEQGSGQAAAEAAAKDSLEAGNKLFALAEKLEKEGKMSFSQALTKVRDENPALAKLADA